MSVLTSRGMDKRKTDGRVVVTPPVRVFSQLGVRLPADLAVRLRTYSLSSGRSLNAIATTALTRYLDQEEGERAPR